jgi:3-isopropylmalate/(R)-2-methylmalate dehydratase small subunit
MSPVATGRAWLFGHDINTDLIQPSPVVLLPIEQQVRHVFEANRPGWVDLVEPGDIIVAGRNFGTGSSRPASKVLGALGIGAVVAESINGLFFRNCVNFGFPALEVPGCLDIIEEGAIARVDVERGELVNETTGAVAAGAPWPSALARILAAGGLMEQLEQEGSLVMNTTRS